ncbi:AraC family transcriptional regulator [Pseudonocardia ailaonensis]|uniref:AraC family transcriptional regulator n=1 Tax=Pseudonocardia ailaonensis TaxID=367279 RepID=A0ABN2NDJ9_9PSEU
MRRHARPDLTTAVDGLLLSRVDRQTEPDHSLAEPLLVLMAQGGKELFLGDRSFGYRAGDYLLVTTDLPVTGQFVDATPEAPALGIGIRLRPAVIAALLLEAPLHAALRSAAPALAVGRAGPELLDAVLRLLRLLERPGDVAVLAPMLEREILWRVLTGPHGPVLRQIGLADSTLTHVGLAIRWIRDHHAEPLRIEELARRAAMSSSAFHRHFRAVTAMSPVQFQKRIRLQRARSLLLTSPGDVAGAGHAVGYDSPSQFSREYRRLFGAPPGRDVAALRVAGPAVERALP